jgi:hypothetical protein
MAGELPVALVAEDSRDGAAQAPLGELLDARPAAIGELFAVRLRCLKRLADLVLDVLSAICPLYSSTASCPS